jgi:hypothetical protein
MKGKDAYDSLQSLATAGVNELREHLSHGGGSQSMDAHL